MKEQELKALKETYEQLKTKRDEVNAIKKEIKELEETEEVKKYFQLKNDLKVKTSGGDTNIDCFDDKQLITIAVSSIDITADEEVYVYLGSYKYNYEMDIEHGSSDYPVKRNSPEVDYVEYGVLGSKYNDTIVVPKKELELVRRNHKIIYPEDAVSNERYFYDLQNEYFEAMILKTPEEAEAMINKLVFKQDRC